MLNNKLTFLFRIFAFLFLFFGSGFAKTTSETNEVVHQLPDTIMVLPFVILLLMIATGPLFYKHFWEHHYPKVAIFLGLITVVYYLFFLKDTHSLVHTLAEYLSFIALLSSLFVASGGILIKVDRKGTPLVNVIILLFGAVLSNFIGTTGASMLLIRPFIKLNKDRIKPYHIIFFIFIVSNIGGALTPIGDPPLFLGFLRGVGFFWVVEHIWFIWLPTVILILMIFYVIDMMNKQSTEESSTYTGKIEFKGLKNIAYLLLIIISVFIDPGIISWVPSLAPLPFGIREIIMFSIVFISFKTADKEVLKANEFDFEPIKEVAYLFIGIFATMIPALQLIAHEANVYGTQLTPGIFYWATGVLSGLLDNAPTYLNFLSAAMGKFNLDVNDKMQVLQFEVDHAIYLVAISVAAVFFGAMSYIGNGPNFMVKSICERAGIKMPSFFGYIIKYSVPILLPVFAIVWYIFINGKV
ncbi:MAG: sodium:proton antiporter [Ignavibacteriales bacterium]|nr:MAG: sodium:proton antiporter [Ignavibacteriales bacterium]